MYTLHIELKTAFFNKRMFLQTYDTEVEARDALEAVLTSGWVTGPEFTVDSAHPKLGGHFVLQDGYMSPDNILRAYITTDMPF